MTVIKFLTSHPSCDFNIRDNQGNTPLMTLVYHQSSMITIARFLIEKCKCDITIKNNKGYTVCHIACLAVLPNCTGPYDMLMMMDVYDGCLSQL